MPPVPKRKHSSRRQGKRRRALRINLPPTTKCTSCGAVKPTHQACPECGQ